MLAAAERVQPSMPAVALVPLFVHAKLLQSSSQRIRLRCLRSSRPLPAWEYRDYLGWMEQGDGKLAYGIFVQNGRLKGAALVRHIQKQYARRHPCSSAV